MSESFEKHLRDQLAGMEQPYNEQHWKGIARKLGIAFFLKRTLQFGVAAGVSTAVLFSLGVFDTPTTPTVKSTVEKEVVAPGNQQPEQTEVVPVVKTEERESNPVIEGTPQPIENPESATLSDTETAEQEPANEMELADTPNPVEEEIKETPAEMPQLGLSFSKNQACPSENIQFNAQLPSEPVELKWHFGDGTTSEKPSPVHAYKKPGNYNVRLEMKSLLTDDVWVKKGTEHIQVFEAPDVQIIAETKSTTGIPKTFLKSNLSENTTWEWKVNGKVLEQKHPELFLHNKGSYLIELTVKSDKGCVVEKHQNWTVMEDFNFLAPNAFTPNSDGVNDLFLPKALENGEHAFVMEIFNPTTGERIFETDDANNPWNGTHSATGAPVEPGSYGWVLKVELPGKGFEKYSGTIEIVP